MRKPEWRVWLEDKRECEKWYRTYLKKGVLRMRKLKAGLYLRKALHNLDFGNWIYEKHKDEIRELFGNERFFDWVVVIYYYAVYHASLALIASKGVFSKSHTATLCALILHFYHKGKIEKEYVEILAESTPRLLEKEDIETIVETKELRERASYGVSYDFEESLAKKAKENALKFIEKARTILEI